MGAASRSKKAYERTPCTVSSIIAAALSCLVAIAPRCLLRPRTQLEKKGHVLAKRSKLLFVSDYEKNLAELPVLPLTGITEEHGLISILGPAISH